MTTRRPFTLRLTINLIVGGLTLLFVTAVIGLQLRGLRDSVHEEVVAANRVAAQLLDRTAWRYAAQGPAALQAFLQSLGRIRANDVTLFDAGNRPVYQSPPSPYKAGREAPDWFSRLIAPPPSVRSIQFPDSRLEVQANASRAVLDAWDELAWLTGTGLALLVAVNGLVFWGVGRAVRPFGQIEQALGQMQAGRLDVQLPPLPGREAAAIGQAFNRMTSQLGEHLATERRALRAELQLSDSRELTRWTEHHVEQERRLIARELHDELGQSVTAMRSMALSIAGRSAGRGTAQDDATAQAAQVIADEALRLYDAMHGIIPRLTPLVLDNFGLADALTDLLTRTQRSHPAVQVTQTVALGDTRLAADAALTLYRGAQEAITNALRHGHASRIQLQLSAGPDAVALQVDDNGQGLPAEKPAPGSAHFGLRWLAERAQALGGTLQLAPGPGGGARLSLQLPLTAAARLPAIATPPGPTT